MGSTPDTALNRTNELHASPQTAKMILIIRGIYQLSTDRCNDRDGWEAAIEQPGQPCQPKLMQDTSTISAIKRFLSLLREGSAPSDRELSCALDQLAIRYHETGETSPAESDVSPPSRESDEYKSRHAELSKRFPNYGYYRVGDWTDPENSESLLADAIDDLTDIERDLEDVLWRFEHMGAEDAHWHFKFEFETHWGRHLRELSLYLFERIARDAP